MRIKKSRYFISLILTFFIVLFFQNCSQVDFSTLNSPSSDIKPIQNAIESGNGGGYTGITIEAKPYLKPGESTPVKILGGVAPYTLTASHSDVSIASTQLADEFMITLDSQSKIQSFTLEATDASGQKAQKSIWIYVLEVPELQSVDMKSKGGDLGTELTMNSQMAFLQGRSWNSTKYGRGGLFVFSHENNDIQRLDQDELLGSEDIRHQFYSIDSNEKYVLTGNRIRPKNSRSLVGSITLYSLEDHYPKIVDSFYPPKVMYPGYFGESVSLYGDSFVVSQPSDIYQLGRVYIYQILNNKAQLLQTLVSPHKDYFNFGIKVKMTAHHLFVMSGYKGDSSAVSNYSAYFVHIYKKNSQNQWAFQKRMELAVDQTEEWRNCGYEIDASLNRFFMTCYLQTLNPKTGAPFKRSQVFIYKENQGQWSLDQKIEVKISNEDVLSFSDIKLARISAYQDTLAVSGSDNYNHNVIIYKLNPDTDQYQPWKQLFMADNSIENFSRMNFLNGRIKLYQNKLLISLNTIYHAFSLLTDVNQLPDIEGP